MFKALAVILALPILLASTQANALARTGKITGLFLSSPGNLPFRISLDNAPTECAAGILYVDTTHPNYQAYVSALMLAYSQGKQVTIYYAPAQAVPNAPLPACAIQEFGVF
ncbi:hypothetical protein ASD79_21395 [Caulobacter sp. Root655]|uniref:hypothetical protein n=1 Tax=Caulobacter sp. Root655 TaxID=1736578 RepID=UPI0006FB32ED|nr:hypothetical protein [Caulobacter sp. Root655]KRA63852.1 hypothetical protein ASD79_21395 [Caulobacter sp. Root655]